MACHMGLQEDARLAGINACCDVGGSCGMGGLAEGLRVMGHGDRMQVHHTEEGVCTLGSVRHGGTSKGFECTVFGAKRYGHAVSSERGDTLHGRSMDCR